MKQAILVFEWARPKYLRVCLDSLARLRNRSDWPVLLSIDGSSAIFEPLMPRCALVKGWPSHVGNLWHVTRSLEWAFSLGCHRVLFMDGDVILRSDALVDLPAKEPKDILIGMTSREGGDAHKIWLTPSANIVDRADAIPWVAWVRSRAWVGHPRPGVGTTMKADYSGYDAVYLDYMIQYQRTCLYRDRSYAGHIGVCGTDCHDKAVDGEIFKGPPEGWLDKAVRLFDPSRSKAFTPPDFQFA